jgi:hypothetical protein
MIMAFDPYYAKNVDFVLGEEATGYNFKCQLRSVTLTPDVNTERIKTLCPEGQFSNVDDPEWTLELGYLFGNVTDAVNDQSLADFLLDHMGEKMPFYYAPRAGGSGYTGTVTILPGPIGGEQGGFSEQSVSLPVDGQPGTWAGVGTPAALAAPAEEEAPV